ncbi:hypothetical protein PGT21_019297 [Puccinia graminis f. sp. tritici]|uniref:Uncharacterized protein n=1 Tax=Puccinia graminis f. sp. tritici TaxID=56615 RepID=A0A5B0N943_PUCGR|nr:hypothetical protein PGT21_019297 [Puccinia graminis f. sp. tritici]
MRMINEDGRGDNSFYTTSKSIFFELTSFSAVGSLKVIDEPSQNYLNGKGPWREQLGGREYSSRMRFPRICVI